MKNIYPLLFFSGIFVIFPLLNSTLTLDPETVLRTVAMGILILPFLFYYLTKMSNNKWPSFMNQKTILFFLTYCIITAFSLIKAVNPGDGIFDTLKLFLFLAVIFVTSQLLAEEEGNLDILIRTVNISVIIFSGFGIVQLIQLFNESKDFNQAFVIGQSVKSSLGNKNSYAEVLSLSLPFCLYGVFQYRKTWKLISLFNSFIILISIFILMNLYVWLALATGAFLVLTVLVGYKGINNFLKDHKRSVMIFIMTILILVSVAGWFIIRSSGAKAIRDKIVNTLSYIKHPQYVGEHKAAINDNNIHERLVLVKNTCKMIKANWETGVGASNWKIYEPLFGQASITSNIRVDYPHNDYLCVFAETGFTGIASYILFIFFASSMAIRIYKNTGQRKLKILSLLMFGGIIAFSVLSLFGFAKEKFFPMMFFIIMIALLLSIDNKESDKKKSPVRLMLIVFIPVIMLLAGIGVIRIFSEMHLQQALKAKKFKRWEEVVTEAGNAYSYFYPVDYSATPIQWYKGMGYFYSDKIDSALIYLKQGESSNPFHVQLLNDIGTCYELKGEHKKSIEYFQRAFLLDPYLVRENLVAAYFNSGLLNNALDLACDVRFEKPVFLQEILHAKAMKFYNRYKGDKTDLLKKMETKGWLLTVFEKSKLLKISLEMAIIDEISQ